MKICLFSSYSEKSTIDNYIKFYLEMLKKHFDKVIFITNHREISNKERNFLEDIDVKLKFVQNEGLDFGMWSKALKDIEVDKCDQIAFVNDSCVLFNNKSLSIILEWVDKCDLDYCGITDSNQINYHLQSYFTVVKKRAIKKIVQYYEDNGVINGDSRNIIEIYEIGLSQLLIKNNYKVGSYFTHKNYKSENISIMEAPHLIKNGYPMVKKKLLLNSFRDHEASFLRSHNFNFNFNYRSLINNQIKNKNICLEYLMEF